MADPFDLDRALAAYTVPALPAGFADDLVARARAEKAAAPTSPWTRAVAREMRPRRGAGRRWWRALVLGGGMLATGMISISAAATGFLGDPISEAVHHAASHVPVVGHLLERALPAHTRHGLFRREEHRAHGPRHVEVARATPGGSKSDGPYTTLP